MTSDASAGIATLEQNSEWLSHQNLSSYRGMWLAIVDRQIVAKDRSAAVVIKAARTKAPKTTPYIVSVPEGILTI